MNYATATRAEIRELVRINSEELLEFAKSGGNAHQKQLDQADLIDEEVARLAEDERERFYKIYVEEMNAKSQETLEKASRMNEQAALLESGDKGFGSIILVGCVVVAVIALIAKLSS